MQSADLIAEFLSRAQAPFDLARQSDLDEAQALAERLIAGSSDAAQLEALEHELAAVKERVPLVLHLAVKMARSRRLLLAAKTGFKVSVVFAVYKETERLKPPEQHEHGEDFIHRKLAQLQWLLEGIEGADFEMIVVDDGCPDHSGEQVRRRADELGPLGKKVHVLNLAEAIKAGHPAVQSIQNTDESRKGGSIQLGLWHAAGSSHEVPQIALFTDADLSTHLGQCGLLIAPILAGQRAAIGSRRHVDSIVIKGGARNDRGKLFIYLWKGMLTPLHEVTDTQCGFKAFRAEGLQELLKDPIERQFAFDLELLLRCELASPGATVRAPVAWFDSEAMSTTTDLQPYLSMLKKAAAMYRRYLEPNSHADGIAAFVEALDEPSFNVLLNAIPTSITERDPRVFSEWRAVSVQALSEAIENARDSGH